MLSSFSYGGKAKLDELSRIMGLPGKPGGMDGSQVEAYFNAGRIEEIADYCKSDVINTYRLWLRHELFRGRLDQKQFDFSDQVPQPQLSARLRLQIVTEVRYARYRNLGKARAEDRTIAGSCSTNCNIASN